MTKEELEQKRDEFYKALEKTTCTKEQLKLSQEFDKVCNEYTKANKK